MQKMAFIRMTSVPALKRTSKPKISLLGWCSTNWVGLLLPTLCRGSFPSTPRIQWPNGEAIKASSPAGPTSRTEALLALCLKLSVFSFGKSEKVLEKDCIQFWKDPPEVSIQVKALKAKAVPKTNPSKLRILHKPSIQTQCKIQAAEWTWLRECL